jgi:hypothetical protein
MFTIYSELIKITKDHCEEFGLDPITTTVRCSSPEPNIVHLHIRYIFNIDGTTNKLSKNYILNIHDISDHPYVKESLRWCVENFIDIVAKRMFKVSNLKTPPKDPNKYWKTKSGHTMKITEMSDQHLENAIQCLKRHGEKSKHIKRLQTEIERRIKVKHNKTTELLKSLNPGHRHIELD